MLHMLAAMLAAGANGPQLVSALDNLRPVLAPDGQDRLEPTGPQAAEAAAALEEMLALLGEVAARLDRQVRPPTSYTNALKTQGIADYGYADKSLSSYEEDHQIPLELGGSPRDPGNLWPEPYSGTKTATTKDGVETKLKNAVCKGRLTLSAARTAIKNNWTTALSATGIG